MASTESSAPLPHTTSHPANPSTRRPYHGSCHCGLTRYIAYLTLPPPIVSATPPPGSQTLRIYKCNCSTCHKMSFFHVRLMDSPGDFLLLSPLDPASGESGLRDYMCFAKNAHWYFCGVCGVRCFTVAGEGEVREAEVQVEGGKEKRRVWGVKREGWDEVNGPSYLSVNAATLEPGQEGFDLREWTEKGWIAYFDSKDEIGEDRLLKPHVGGMY